MTNYNPMNKIPKVIHQIWSGVDGPLPDYLSVLGDTWKSNHPDWRYEYWDNDRMNDFVADNYPQYVAAYNRFRYRIQQWDAIRYLILHKSGGMYVDFDYECIKPVDDLLHEKECCFPVEPEQHRSLFPEGAYINNALMACMPGHPFMELIMKHVFEETHTAAYDTMRMEILSTTGPVMLSKLYNEYKEKEHIYLIPAHYVSPFSKPEARAYLSGSIEEEELEDKLEHAYAVHYFLGSWVQ